MGLNAVVYRSSDAIMKLYPLAQLQIDQVTGEVTTVHSSPVNIPREVVVAVDQRLGNASEIGNLRKEVHEVLNSSTSISITRILYSGSHSGDLIECKTVPILRKELETLKEDDRATVKKFVESVEALAKASENEKNPIVFE